MRGHIPTLDGWRAIAILWVMLVHSNDTLFGPSGLMPSAILERISAAGTRGVDIFFGLSGFLITALLLREHERSGSVSLRSFYIRRTFRILPPFWCALAAVCVLGLLGVIAVDWAGVLGAATFTFNYLPGSSLGLIGNAIVVQHSWSLAVEEHFYLLWPPLLVWLAPRRAGWAALGIALAVGIWRPIDAKFHVFESVTGLDVMVPTARTDMRLDGMLYGAVAAILVSSPRCRAMLTRLLRPSVWAALVAAFLVLSFHVVPVPLGRLWLAVLIPLLLLGTVLHPGSIAGRVLEWGPLRRVGRLSFSLYLWQQLFLLVPMGAPWERLGRWSIAAEWGMAFVFALASERFIEGPSHRLGRRLGARRERWRGLRRNEASLAETLARFSEVEGGYSRVIAAEPRSAAAPRLE
jgi:peptidoglycan/LPS O-acetylase OafA/YrhL